MTSIAELADRAVVHIGGADARDFLQGLLTSDLAALTPAAPLYAGLLSAQGKALFDMLLFDGGDGAVLIDVAVDQAEALGRRLTMYRLRRAVTVAASPLRAFAAWGGSAGQAADPRTPLLGERWLADAAVTTATADDYDRHRLAVGVPSSVDIGTDKLLWLETNAAELHGVSFTKGCYVGQENTARMHHRDRLRKRLLPVRFDGDPGDGRVMSGEREAGLLTSHRGDHGVAHLRLEFVENGQPLTLGTGNATVVWPQWLAR